MKIKCSLSAGSIRAAAQQLERYAQSLTRKSESLVRTLGEKGVEYANEYLEHDDTGETRGSIQYTHEGQRGTISVGGAAVWIEFGTGVLANAGNTPHPKRDEVGAVPWGEYGRGYGKGIWEFPSRKFGWIPTQGIPLNPFMYLSAQALRNELSDLAKEAFRDD